MTTRPVGCPVRGRSGWVEHTWSTFIERAEDDDEELLPGRQRLSDFQQSKFRHFFYHVLDLNNDHVISEEDFMGLNSRVRHYMEWSINTAQYLILTEVRQVNSKDKFDDNLAIQLSPLDPHQANM